METPKEKALSLYKEFHYTCKCTIAGTSTIFREIAKDCALICVREQLKSLQKEKLENELMLFQFFLKDKDLIDDYKWSYSELSKQYLEAFYKEEEYWEQVKKELDNVY